MPRRWIRGSWNSISVIRRNFIVALAPEIILSVWGIVLLLVGVSPRRSHDAGTSADLGWLTLLGILAAALANLWLYTVTEVGTHSMIALDRFALFSNWIILSGAGLGVLISQSYIKRQGLQAAEFYGLLIYSTVGLMIMAAARDLIAIFLGLEIMSIAGYVLAAINRRDPRSAEAGLKYFLLGAFSTGFFLYGIALVYGATGSTHIFGHRGFGYERKCAWRPSSVRHRASRGRILFQGLRGSVPYVDARCL